MAFSRHYGTSLRFVDSSTTHPPTNTSHISHSMAQGPHHIHTAAPELLQAVPGDHSNNVEILELSASFWEICCALYIAVHRAGLDTGHVGTHPARLKLKELFLNILTECLLTLMTSVAEPEQRNCAVLLFQHLGVLYLKTVKGCRVPGPGLAPGVTDTRL